MTQLGVSNTSMVPIYTQANSELLDQLAKNSHNSFFNVPGSSSTADNWGIWQEQVAVRFPNAISDKQNPGTTLIVTDMRGIQGPEIGTDNIKAIADSMLAAGYNKHVVEKACNSILLKNVQILGITAGSAKYSGDKSDKSRSAPISVMIRGQGGYTNFEHVQHRVGDLLIADIPTIDELNAVDSRKSQMRGTVHAGTVPIILRKYKTRDLVQRSVEDLVTYLNDPDIFRSQIRSTNRADVAHLASVHNLTRFALYCCTRGLGYILGATGLTLAPIESFDPARHLLLGGADRNIAVNRDLAGGNFTVAAEGSAPFAGIRRALYRQANVRDMPADGVSAAGIKRATESATLETIFATVTGLINGSPTSTSDRTNEFSGVVAARLRADRRLAESSADKNPLPGSFLALAQDFTEELTKSIFYGADMKSTISTVDTKKQAFGAVIGNDGQVLRNLAMTTGGRSRIIRPNPNSEFGEMAQLQQIMPAQGLAAMADMIDLKRRRIVGVATRNQGHLGAGGVMLTHCSY